MANEIDVEIGAEKMTLRDAGAAIERMLPTVSSFRPATAISSTPSAPRFRDKLRLFHKSVPDTPQTCFDALVLTLTSALLELIKRRGRLRIKPVVRVSVSPAAAARFGDYHEEVLTAALLLAGARRVSFQDQHGWKPPQSHQMGRILVRARLQP